MSPTNPPASRRLPRHPGLLLLLAAGSCDDVPGEDVRLTCDAAAFEEAWSPFDLPDIDVPEDFWHRAGPSTGSCSEEGPLSMFLDVNGDGVLDHLRADACFDDAERPRFAVSVAGDDGWRAPEIWRAPKPLRGAWLGDWTWSVRGAEGCGPDDRGRYAYDKDMDGDGWVDWVFLEDCVAPGEGQPHVRVHRGGPEGWSDAEQWNLPTAEPPVDLFKTEFLPREQNSELIDFDSDGRPDVVRYDRWDDGYPRGWSVWWASERGWSDEPTVIPLPEGMDRQPFPIHDSDATSSGFNCEGEGEGSLRTAFSDLVGDARPDLIQMSACDDDVVGVSHWRVWEQVDGGFSTESTLVSVPSIGGGRFVGEAVIGGGIGWTCDIDGEERRVVGQWTDLLGLGRKQLVLHTGCASAAHGDAVWAIYPFETGGYRADPLLVPVPPIPSPEPYSWRAGTMILSGDNDSGDCPQRGGDAWVATLSHEAPATLVVSRSCSDHAVGEEYWLSTHLTCDTPRELVP